MSAFVHSSQAQLYPDALAAVKHHAEALELPSCPFCGGAAQVCLGAINCASHILIRCSRCGCSTSAINAGTREPAEGDNPRPWAAKVRAAITAASVRWSCRP